MGARIIKIPKGDAIRLKDLQKAISEGCIIKKDETDPTNEMRVVTLEEAVNFTD